MKPLPIGVLPDFPVDAYHADPGIGGHAIGALAQSPAHFYYSRLVEKKTTKSMDFGTAFHARVLQPHVYEKTVVECAFEYAWNRKDGMAFKERTAGERGVPEDDLIFLKPSQVLAIRCMRESWKALCERELEGEDPLEFDGPAECPHFWEEVPGMRAKALTDKIVTDLHWIVDVKTTETDLDDRSLFAYAADWMWSTQAAWYRRGVSRLQGWDDVLFAFAVFQTKPPFAVRWVPLSVDAMAKAEILCDRGIENYLELVADLAAGRRPRDGISGTTELRFPQWALDKLGIA